MKHFSLPRQQLVVEWAEITLENGSKEQEHSFGSCRLIGYPALTFDNGQPAQKYCTNLCQMPYALPAFCSAAWEEL